MFSTRLRSSIVRYSEGGIVFLAFSLPYTTTRKFIFYHFWNYVPTPGSTKSMHNVSVLNSTDPLAGESLIFNLSGITEAADNYVTDLTLSRRKNH